ncbi:MAG: CHAP domain-containing protein [Agathobacter sp.]|nr:CHAP domain-containing protein [Agathobacter sp.]
MKKTLSRVLALILAVVLALPAFSATPVEAAPSSWDNVTATKYASRYFTSDYATGKFYDNMTSIPLTGDGARDVVAVAASQMGYIEGDSSAGYDGETGGSTNYTEYGYYIGLSGGSSHAWCAAFCSWSFYVAEVTDVDGYTADTNSGNIWADSYVPDWSGYLINQGRYRYSYYSQYSLGYGTSQAFYVPQPGDLVFFNTASGDYPGWEGHIGLVAYSDGEYVYTLEGNTSSQDGVESEGGGAFMKTYSLYGTNIIGYGVMPYETVAGLPEIDYTGSNPTPGLYVTTNGATSVYSGIDDTSATWTLPMSSVFEVLDVETASDGIVMLKAKCEINGQDVYGYIPNGSDSNSFPRTFQIYASSSIYDETVDADRDGIPDSYNPSKNDEGDYTFENAYGYEFRIGSVDGTIAGEDATMITNATSYAACNPNWAISVQLRPTENADEYKVVKVVATPGSAENAGITFEDGDLVMVVHSAASQPGYSNWMGKVAALTLSAGDVVNVSSDYKTVTILDKSVDPEPDTPVDPEDPEVPEEPDTPYVPVPEDIKYQIRDKDIRLISYVDNLSSYNSVAFTITVDGTTSSELVCTHAYEGLYADGERVTTETVCGKDGYFVTYVITNYLNYFAGKEVTITVKYDTKSGDDIINSRTVTIGEAAQPDEPDVPVEPEEPIETGALTYANVYDWTNTTSQIYAFASSDETATPATLHGQGVGFMGWWNAIVLEYNSTNATWVVTQVCTADGTNEAESVTLGANKLVVIFHADAAASQPESYNFFMEHAVVGKELYLSKSISALQSASGSLSNVTLATGIVETEAPDMSEFDYGGAIPGAGLQGYSADVHYGCDMSFYNVGDSSYSASNPTDSGADYTAVDFAKMKADGCDFVILRLGSADSTGIYYDPHFVKLYNMAREAGMHIGVYFYSMAYSKAEAIEEAEFVIDVIEDHGMYFEYPIYIDIEESGQLALGMTTLSDMVNGWCETLIDAGYFPGIYGNLNLYDLLSDQVKTDYDFWMAWVSSATGTSTYSPQNGYNLSAGHSNISDFDGCSMWQYSFYGYNYDGAYLDLLDVNVSYKDYPAIMEAGGYNNM